MKLTADQHQALQSGQAVHVYVGGTPCVLLRKEAYEQGDALNFSPWTPAEIDLLAAEAADLLAGDGLDEPDDS